MKRIAIAAMFGSVLLLASDIALADYDARDEQEAKAFQAKSKEAAKKEAARKQKLKSDNTKAEADMYRQVLGEKAKGKSDAEVVEMMKVHLTAVKKQYGQ